MIFPKIIKRKILLLFGDIIIIILSFNIAFYIRFDRLSDFDYALKNPVVLLVILPSYIISFYVFNLYDVRGDFLRIQSIIFFLAALLAVGLLAMISFYLYPFGLGRGIFFISFITTGVLTFIWRLFFTSFFQIAIPKRKILIAGQGNWKENLAFLFQPNLEYQIAGYLSENPQEKNPELSTFSCLGDIGLLEEDVDSYNIDDIVVMIDIDRKRELQKSLVNCRMKGINVFDLPTFCEYAMNKVPVLCIKDAWLIYCQGFDRLGSAVYRRAKRGFDFMGALLLLILFAPFCILIALFIKISSRGPILYIQERMGENRKSYKMYKFRTMVIDAEKGEPKWAEEDDRRVTTVGKMLRKIRLDELPQLINVLKGEMSLIGPRPEREYFIRILLEKIPYYSLRYAAKPGITGWAQVNYRYGASVEDAIEKLRYDLYYIKNMSFFLDLRILLRTVRVSLFGMGR